MNAATLPRAATLLPQAGHVPVMLAEVLHYLAPADGEAILDCTFGGGGYARAILDAGACTLWAIDRDPDAIARGNALRAALASHGQGERLHMLQGGFGGMAQLARAANAPAFNGIVMDLGVSSFQLDEAERGFSFRHNGPLDMRMEKSGQSAADLVNTASEQELADIIHFYGEERHARRVARAIVTARAQEPFTTTLQLAELVRASVPHDRSGLDGATRTFQGLRIAVNDELGEIERGLTQALDLLAPGGRLVVVSFHSLEDRLAKRAIQRATGRDLSFSRHDPRAAMGQDSQPPFKTLTGKAVRPGETECRINPRARSARLRALLRRPDTASPPVVEN